MHHNSYKWLSDLSKQYPRNFKGARVLEIGSYDFNGTIRDFFSDCDYIGVDALKGPGVDIVALGEETEFEKESFDTLAVFSVFEHDSNWRKTLSHNLQWVKPNGMIFVSFGAEGNPRHRMNWKLVPHQEFLDYCSEIGLEIVDAFDENERYGRYKRDRGIYDVILKKHG